MANLKTGGPPAQLMDGKDDDIDPKDLLFDPGNYRLIEIVPPKLHDASAVMLAEPSIQDAVFHALVDSDKFDVDALVRSIAKNGFLNHEKLIVAPVDGHRYLVLEGNRRLAAVRRLQTNARLKSGLPRRIQDSYEHLPCFVLEGKPIDGDEDRLREFREHAAIYVGMRHLMRAKQWSPSGRYEFQAQLVLNDGWTIKQVADHFGSSEGRVKNELRAQILYHDFAKYRRQQKSAIPVTYNAFAEMAKSPDIAQWLSWDTKKRRVGDKDREHALFDYLTSRLEAQSHRSQNALDRDEKEEIERITAEKVVRRLRDMLKLGDDDVSAALADKDFASAEMLYEGRRSGIASARIRECKRKLERIAIPDIKADAQPSASALDELLAVAEDLKTAAEGFFQQAAP